MGAVKNKKTGSMFEANVRRALNGLG